MMRFKPLTVSALAIVTMLMAGTSHAKECENPVTEQEVAAIQGEWAEAIVAIGAADVPIAVASAVLDKLYGYDYGKVLFKPTKAETTQFRLSKPEALSYFVGGDLPEDKGFALAPYTHVRFENGATVVHCDTAYAVGNYYFTDTSGAETKVEYTFGYFRDDDGDLKIKLHHSSLPYQAK